MSYGSQIANVSLETFSERDKFWVPPRRRSALRDDDAAAARGGRWHSPPCSTSIRRSNTESVRVKRFLRLGAFSLDVDVFAYVIARDWTHFLEIQEQLLFAVTGIVERPEQKSRSVRRCM